jgi:hypothetical protein
MAFSIPNENDAYSSKQAEFDSVDITIMIRAARNIGVVKNFGGEAAVSALATPALAIQVASGTIRYERTWTDVSAVSSWGITAADSINPRFDLVCVNNVGSLSITAGAPAAAPVFPTIPTSSIPLAALYVPASCTVCSPGQIIDKRMSIDAPVENIPIVVGSGSAWAVPSALTEWGGSTRNRLQMNLGSYSQFRFCTTMVSSLGAAATRIGVQYSPQNNAFTNSWFGLDNNTGAGISTAQCHADSLTTLVSPWGTICDSAWTASDVTLRIVANSGAAQNAFFGSTFLQLR